MNEEIRLIFNSSRPLRNIQNKKLWSAIHTLIMNSLIVPETEEVEEGELEQQQSTTEEEEEEEKVEIIFSSNFFLDPSGIWTEILDSQGNNQLLSYETPTRSSIVGMEDNIAAALALAGVDIKKKLSNCYNCGQTGHEVPQCPLPLDRKRIAEAKQDQANSGSRYHEQTNSLKDKYPNVKIGELSSTLRNALGLLENDNDPFIKVRERLGPPPINENEHDNNEGFKSEEEKTIKMFHNPEDSIVNDNDDDDDEESDDEDEEEEDKKTSELSLKCKFDSDVNSSWDQRLLPICTCNTSSSPCPRSNRESVNRLSDTPRKIDPLVTSSKQQDNSRNDLDVNNLRRDYSDRNDDRKRARRRSEDNNYRSNNSRRRRSEDRTSNYRRRSEDRIYRSRRNDYVTSSSREEIYNLPAPPVQYPPPPLIPPSYPFMYHAPPPPMPPPQQPIYPNSRNPPSIFSNPQYHS